MNRNLETYDIYLARKNRENFWKWVMVVAGVTAILLVALVATGNLP